MKQEEALKAVIECLDRKKAEDIKVLRITKLTVIADYFVIAHGTSSTQTRALADEVEVKLKDMGLPPERIQGTPGCGWVILDNGDGPGRTARKWIYQNGCSDLPGMKDHEICPGDISG